MQSASPTRSLPRVFSSSPPVAIAGLLPLFREGRPAPALRSLHLLIALPPGTRVSPSYLLQVFVPIPLPSEAFPAWHFKHCTCLSLYSLSSFLALFIYPHTALLLSNIIYLFGLLCLFLHSQIPARARTYVCLVLCCSPSSWKTDWHMVGPHNILVRFIKQLENGNLSS